jgi:hypothetical protein
MPLRAGVRCRRRRCRNCAAWSQSWRTRPAAEHWTLDGLVDVVEEAMALARLRAVRPQDLKGLGLMLPGIFLSNNYRHDVPSVDFAKMLDKNLSVLRVAGGQTSEKSFMKMADGTTTLFE